MGWFPIQKRKFPRKVNTNHRLGSLRKAPPLTDEAVKIVEKGRLWRETR